MIQLPVPYKRFRNIQYPFSKHHLESITKIFLSQIIYYRHKIQRSIIQLAFKITSQIYNHYLVEGSFNRIQNLEYFCKNLEPKFEEKMENFKQLIVDCVALSKPLSILKFGDGDYYFLNGIPEGSAKPGNRALSRALSSDELVLIRERFKQCNYYSCEILKANRRKFAEVFPNKQIDFPAEFHYALLANKWLTKTFNGRIGLIGGNEKIGLIRELINFDSYKEYLGLDGFQDYIDIPQRFACDDLISTEKSIADQLINSKADIFLIGIGHAKSAVLSQLHQYRNAVFLDIGSGIDALAGVIDRDRPYFGEWENYRIESFDYSKIDFLQYKKSQLKYVSPL